jgi:hypothetical protein
MTVRAADLTLRDFSYYPLPCHSNPDQSVDVRFFNAPHVIELKDTHIGFSAIDAMMSGEVLRHCAPISCAVARRIYHAPLIMEHLVSAIVTSFFKLY